MEALIYQLRHFTLNHCKTSKTLGRWWRYLSLLLLLALSLSGCTLPVKSTPSVEPAPSEPVIVETPASQDEPAGDTDQDLKERLKIAEAAIVENGKYSTQEEVAAYLHVYGKLPSNFISKNKATQLGWESNKGNLWDVTDQMSIGGDGFGNREGLLPSKEGRRYYECDVNYEGGFRGAQRLVYSNDGLIFYTSDHYASFIQFY